MTPLRLDGRRVLVTGASSGIGRATAVWLSRLGASLVLAGRDESRLKETLAQLESRDHAISAIDLSTQTSLDAWMNELTGSSGLSGLVHAAGIQVVLPLKALTLDKWQQQLQVNTTTAFLLSKAFRQRSVARPPASIVFMSSIMASASQPALTAYSASKGALEAMARSLALELAPQGIRVNCVAPGTVRTSMVDRLAALIGEDAMRGLANAHPLGLGEAEDVAYAVGYLLSPAARWVTGTTLTVDGGYLAR